MNRIIQKVPGLKFLDRFIDGMIKHDLTTHAAALAFYTALSLSPLLLIIIMIVGILGESAEARLIAQIHGLMGADIGKAIQVLLKSIHKSKALESSSGIFGIATIAFSASAVFSQLQNSLNAIWEIKLVTQVAGWISYLRRKIFSIGTVFVFGFFELVSLVANTIIAAIFPTGAGFWKLLNELLTIFIFTNVFIFVFKYFSYQKLPFKAVLYGALSTAVLFTIGKLLVGVYLGRSAVSSPYGAAGSLIVILIWVYYSSLIVFIGAEVTATLLNSKNYNENSLHKSSLLEEEKEKREEKKQEEKKLEE